MTEDSAPAQYDRRMNSQTLVAVAFAVLASGAALADDATDAAGARFASRSVAPTPALCRQLPLSCAGLKPISRQGLPIWESSNDAIIDQREIAFDGLQLTAYYGAERLDSHPAAWNALPRGTANVVEVVITSPRWPVAEGLRVGTPRRMVEGKLGAGPAQGPDACAVYADGKSQDTTTICYANGRVSSIKWTPWWDG